VKEVEDLEEVKEKRKREEEKRRGTVTQSSQR
jgi:hypothetical protein